jgi:hypothetical protein
MAYDFPEDTSLKPAQNGYLRITKIIETAICQINLLFQK